MKSVGTRIITGIIGLILIIGFVSIADSAGVFFKSLSSGVADYNTVTESQLGKNLSMNGTVYTVYDCIATEYSETNGVEKDEAYFYLIEFDSENDIYMVLKTKANTTLDEDIENLCDAYYDDDFDILEAGVYVEGVLKKNQSGLQEQFEDWKDDLSDYGVDVSDMTILEYTFDCTTSLSEYNSEFVVGAVIILIFVTVLIVIIARSAAAKKRAAVTAGGFNQPNNFGQPGQFMPNVPNNMYGQNNYYQPNNIPQPNVQQGFPQQNIPQPNVQQGIPQSNIPQSNIPQPTNFNPNTFTPTSAVPSYMNNNFVQGSDSEQTIYGSEQKVSLDKKDY